MKELRGLKDLTMHDLQGMDPYGMPMQPTDGMSIQQPMPVHLKP